MKSMDQKTQLNHASRLAKKLIHEKFTLTLATASKDAAWAAPVYFVAWNQHFYFFSNPQSRHIREALSSSKSAAAIYEESSQWRELKGIQMSGKVDIVGSGSESVIALGAYIKKFPLMNSFFPDIAAFNLDGVFSRFQARLYRFSPDLIYYMDNSIDFGFREEIRLETLGV
jgi:uncharacterized protein